MRKKMVNSDSDFISKQVIVNCLAHLIKMDKFIYERPLWQIIGRVFGFQITCISIDFLLIFAYCPIMIGYFITMNGIRSINLLRRDFLDSINKIQMISSNCKHKYNQTVKLNILIEKLILHRYMMYVRLNIFSEQIIPYFSPLIILSTIISFVTNQFIWNCLQQIRADQYLLRCLFYYFLILNYSNMLILTYWIAKFNAKLDSLRYVLQATIWHTNPLSNDRFKFHLMFIHERMVSRKPFGMKIGPFSVLTRFVFVKVKVFFCLSVFYSIIELFPEKFFSSSLSIVVSQCYRINCFNECGGMIMMMMRN